MKVKVLTGAGIILITSLLALSGLALIVIFEDDDYLNTYLNVVGAYAKNPGDPVVKNELLDVVEYYIQHEDVNSDLLDTGPRSGEQIITILDKYGAPCACPPGPCSIQGDACCCAGKLYQCSIVGAALSWQFSGDCVDGCCASACCGGVVTTTSTTTTTNPSVPQGNTCANDVECSAYGRSWVCNIPPGKTKGNCAYTGSFTQCSDGTIIGQCSTSSPGNVCMENAQGTGTQLATAPSLC